jgi:ubiquinol-cytochrome c reductase cytochrome b subunit
MPGKGKTERNVVGAPFYPYFIVKTTAFFFFVFAVCALLATFAQINPIWLFGPYNPSGITAGSQPDFYMGALEGALRMMPNWAWNVGGYTIALNVVIPALVPLGIIFGGGALWPFLEQWVTGDYREHHITERPRNASTRTAIGMAAVVFYGVLWLEGANDIIADHLDISLFLTTWIARFAVILGPIIAYWVTKRICLGLQRKDVELLTHGLETGIIRQQPDGEYIEVTRPVTEETRARLESRTNVPPLAITAGDGDDVPAPSARGQLGKLRLAMNRVLLESIPLPTGNGHGNGHGDGHEGEHAAVAAGESDPSALSSASQEDRGPDGGERPDQ